MFVEVPAEDDSDDRQEEMDIMPQEFRAGSSPNSRAALAVPPSSVNGMIASLGAGRSDPAQAAINLSEGGLLVRTGRPMRSGAKVKVRLEIEKFKDVLEADGVVRWCFQEARTDPRFYAGIRLTRVPPALASKFARLRRAAAASAVRAGNIVPSPSSPGKRPSR